MKSEEPISPQSPKTPLKSRLNADDMRLICSDEKPKHFSFVEEILQDPQEENFMYLSDIKEDPLNEVIESAFSLSLHSFHTDSYDDESQEEKCQTVKKFFERLEKEQPAILTTAPKNIKGCNCDKSKCLKNYCVCYKMGNICSPDCECTDCENHQKTEEHLKNEKITLDLMSNAVSKGCNCKNSNCLKKYCECHRFGKKCSELCKCSNCRNMKTSNDKFEEEEAMVRLVFTARKKIKISEFGLQENKENSSFNF